MALLLVVPLCKGSLHRSTITSGNRLYLKQSLGKASPTVYQSLTQASKKKRERSFSLCGDACKQIALTSWTLLFPLRSLPQVSTASSKDHTSMQDGKRKSSFFFCIKKKRVSPLPTVSQTHLAKQNLSLGGSLVRHFELTLVGKGCFCFTYIILMTRGF